MTTAILFFVAAQLIISGLHELSENGVLPSSREEMALIGPIVRNDLFFFVTIVALAALMVLFEVKRRQPAALPDSPAERRKAQWSARRERLWMVSVYASSFLFILMVTAEFIYAKSVSALSPATEVTFQDGQVSIPLAQVSDGDLHRFAARENGVEVRFWLYQKPDGKVATVFDACQICGPVGFYKGPNGVVCKNCAAPINGQSVGMTGGCNPIPLRAEQTARCGHHPGDRHRRRRPHFPTVTMFLRLLYESFRRQKRRKLLAGVAIMLGVGVATAMIAVATDIGDKISRELRTYGANLIVTPQEDTLDVEIGGVNLKPPSDGAYLNEADLPKIKGMFWRNNIVGFAPMLPVSVTLGGARNADSAGDILRPPRGIWKAGFRHRRSHYASLVEGAGRLAGRRFRRRPARRSPGGEAKPNAWTGD